MFQGLHLSLIIYKKLYIIKIKHTEVLKNLERLRENSNKTLIYLVINLFPLNIFSFNLIKLLFRFDCLLNSGIILEACLETIPWCWCGNPISPNLIEVFLLIQTITFVECMLPNSVQRVGLGKRWPCTSIGPLNGGWHFIGSFFVVKTSNQGGSCWAQAFTCLCTPRLSTQSDLYVRWMPDAATSTLLHWLSMLILSQSISESWIMGLARCRVAGVLLPSGILTPDNFTLVVTKRPQRVI